MWARLNQKTVLRYTQCPAFIGTPLDTGNKETNLKTHFQEIKPSTEMDSDISQMLELSNKDFKLTSKKKKKKSEQHA